MKRRYSWYLPITKKEFKALNDGMRYYFRFELMLQIKTMKFFPRKKVLSITFSKDDTLVREKCSIYINGFLAYKDGLDNRS